MNAVQNAARRSSPWKHPRRWVAFLVLAFVLISFIAFRIASTSGVKKHIAAKRAQGLPMSPLELDAWYKPVPASGNAALAFETAFQTYVSPGKINPDEMRDQEVVLGEPLPRELAEAVATHLKANRAAIDEIHAAAQLSASRYSIDLTRGFATLLPHLARLRGLNQLMRWEAIQQSADGNRTEAVRALKSGLAIATSLEEEPLLVSSMVRAAILTTWLRALERVVTEHTLTDPELAELFALITRTEEASRRSMMRAMVGERAMGVAAFHVDYKMFEALSAGGAVPGGSPEWPEVLKVGLYELRRSLGFNDRDALFYLRLMNELETALTNDHPVMLQRATAVTQILNQEISKHPIRYMVSGMILPSLSKAIEKESLLAGHLRSARAALAVERFRLQNSGRLPSANELTPTFISEWPRDPFDNRPLEYGKLRLGYEIISAGATAEKEKKNSPGRDTTVGFAVLR